MEPVIVAIWLAPGMYRSTDTGEARGLPDPCASRSSELCRTAGKVWISAIVLVNFGRFAHVFATIHRAVAVGRVLHQGLIETARSRKLALGLLCTALLFTAFLHESIAGVFFRVELAGLESGR